MAEINDILQRKQDLAEHKSQVHFLRSRLGKAIIVLLAITMTYAQKARAQEKSENRIEQFFNDCRSNDMNTVQMMKGFTYSYLAEFNRTVAAYAKEKMLEIKAAKAKGPRAKIRKLREICGPGVVSNKYCINFVTAVLEQADKILAEKYGIAPIYSPGMMEAMTNRCYCRQVKIDLTKRLKEKGVFIGRKGPEECFETLDKTNSICPLIGINDDHHGALYLAETDENNKAIRDENGKIKIHWISANNESINSSSWSHPDVLFPYNGLTDNDALLFAYTRVAKVYNPMLTDISHMAKAEIAPKINVAELSKTKIKPIEVVKQNLNIKD